MAPKRKPQDNQRTADAIDAIFEETNTEIGGLTVDGNGTHHLTIKTPEGNTIKLPSTTPDQTARIIGHIEENKLRRR